MAGQLAEALTLQRQRCAATPRRRNGCCEWTIWGESRRCWVYVMRVIQQKISKINSQMNAHLSVAFTSASAEISSWQAAVWPFIAAWCRAVRNQLEQKIRRKYRKTKHNKNSVTMFEHECTPVCRIHVSFRWNQQLASCRVTIHCSFMQSGALATRTENKKKISVNKTQQKFSNKFSKMNAHRSVAFTSASAEISSWQAAVWPCSAAPCRAVRWRLKQKIRWKYQWTKHNKNSVTNFQKWMRTCLSHSRQLWLKSAAGKLPCDHSRQRHAERCLGH